MSQPELFPNVRDILGLLCLSCVLDDCDENDKDCLYSKAAAAVVKPDDQVKRGQYFRAYYQLNREKINEANKRRQKARGPIPATPERKAYWKERYEKQKEKKQQNVENH